MAEDATTQEAIQDQSSASNPPSNIDDFLEQARAAAEAEAVEAQGQEPQGESSEETQESPEEATPQTDPESTDQEGLEPSKTGEDQKRYSRRDAERLAQQLDEARQAVQQHEQELEQIKADNEKAATEVRKALGTDEEYEQAKRTALDTRRPQRERDLAAQRVQIFDDNRAFFATLQKVATNTVLANLAGDLGEVVALEGVDRKVVLGRDVKLAFKHVYDAGGKAVAAEKDARITALEAEVKGLKAAQAGRSGPALSGGSSSPLSDLSKYLDKNGALTDEAWELARSGALRG